MIYVLDASAMIVYLRAEPGGEVVRQGALSYAGAAVREDIHLAFAKMAGRLKAELRRISLADCFAVVLAKELDAVLLTADRHELGALDGRSEIKLSFIR